MHTAALCLCIGGKQSACRTLSSSQMSEAPRFLLTGDGAVAACAGNEAELLEKASGGLPRRAPVCVCMCARERKKHSSLCRCKSDRRGSVFRNATAAGECDELALSLSLRPHTLVARTFLSVFDPSGRMCVCEFNHADAREWMEGRVPSSADESRLRSGICPGRIICSLGSSQSRASESRFFFFC